MPNLFVYGSLKSLRLLARLIGRVPASMPAELKGYVKQRLEGSRYPIAVRNPSSTIKGLLLLDLTDEELEVLDQYEDLPHGPYVRVQEVVHTPHGPKLAYVYVARGNVEQ